MMQNEQADNTVNGRVFIRPFYAWSGIAAVLIVGIGLLLPASSNCRCRSQEPHLQAATQVRSLAQGLIIYAGQNNDMFPLQDEWAEVLLEVGLVDPEYLVSPAEDGDGVSYIFIPGINSFSATKIVVYEDPKHWEDFVIVGFADAHVEMIDHEAFERMLAEQLEAQSSP